MAMQPELNTAIPQRIEPKTFFANERTFLSWLHMAVTIGSIGAALLGFSTTASRPAAAAAVPAPPRLRLHPLLHPCGLETQANVPVSPAPRLPGGVLPLLALAHPAGRRARCGSRGLC